jgi:hypothetical protein
MGVGLGLRRSKLQLFFGRKKSAKRRLTQQVADLTGAPAVRVSSERYTFDFFIQRSRNDRLEKKVAMSSFFTVPNSQRKTGASTTVSFGIYASLFRSWGSDAVVSLPLALGIWYSEKGTDGGRRTREREESISGSDLDEDAAIDTAESGDESGSDSEGRYLRHQIQLHRLPPECYSGSVQQVSIFDPPRFRHLRSPIHFRRLTLPYRLQHLHLSRCPRSLPE